MTSILGISAYYHDSAAALVVDGTIVAAAQEERFSRVKHDHRFPQAAAEFCLKAGGLASDELDYIVFYDKPLTKFERLLETYLAFAPRGYASFSRAMPLWLKEKLRMRGALRKALGGVRRAKLVFTDHHESHAASAFFPSPFDEAAILTLDGVGEWSTTTLGVGRGNRLELTHQISFPHSLGLLYSAFTYYCGFKVNSGEYKLMGLAPYGKPTYTQAILDHLIHVRDDGSFWLDMAYFNYCQGLTMTGPRFDTLFGGPPRKPESGIEQRHMDLAASVQAVTEEVVLRMARHLHASTGQDRLVMAGGVALNCVANGRLLREGPFKEIWIQPAAGDAGGALGGALFVWHQLMGRDRAASRADSQRGSFLGPLYSPEAIQSVLAESGVSGQRFEDWNELFARVAELLDEGKVVGWFQGAMEFGPRALGARSILGDPRSPEMQAKMNLKIKFRESFRPFAPCVLKDRAHEWFELEAGQESPYMLIVAPVRDERRVAICPDDQQVMESDPDLRRRVNVPRSSIPAVTHVDYSARIQTVDDARNPRLARLLRAFEARTGCPILVNTSFNVRGEPIVCTPRDAYRCFMATEMDVLVMENFVVEKDESMRPDSRAREALLAQFHPD